MALESYQFFVVWCRGFVIKVISSFKSILSTCHWLQRMSFHWLIIHETSKIWKNFQSFIIIIYLVKRLLFSVISVGIVYFAHSSFCGSMIFFQSQSRSSEYVFIYHSKEVQLGRTYCNKIKYTKNHFIRIHVFLKVNFKKFHTKTSI